MGVSYYYHAPPGVDPARGSFTPEGKTRWPFRPGKTKADRLPVGQRAKVREAARNRLNRRQG